ncbi:acyl-ACP desaturase, partial [Mycobacteroides abscessus subsp. massiliense]|nr:acyl-ACP desaturase [Mycobacteroides abscessus subsp. massiliense]MBL3761056.1 acyl-ACP desaturase [Mycobacteroides abscessus subsp. massiliense]
MQKDFTDLELLYELESVVEENVHRHLGVTKDWNP